MGGVGGGHQLWSVEFSVFLLQLTCERGRPVSAQIRVSYQIITPSIQNVLSLPLEMSLSRWWTVNGIALNCVLC